MCLNKIKRCLLIMLLMTMVSFSYGTSWCAGKACVKCGEQLTGRYFEFDGNYYHPACFVCSRCNKPIQGSFQKSGERLFHPDCYKLVMGMVCTKCGKLLNDQWAVYEGENYHQTCLKKHIHDLLPTCGVCGRKIDGEYTTDEDGKYHIACFREHKLPKCSVCGGPLEGNIIVDAWGNRSHARHGRQSTVTCHSCGRIISKKTSDGGVEYSDGRIQCGICNRSAVLTPAQVTVSRKTVLKHLQSVGITGIASDIPVQLVNADYLREHSTSRHAGNTKGLTRSSVKYLNDKRVSIEQQIYILTGLPQLEFEGVLAHELLHVWLNKENIRMDSSRTEGFCNLGAMVIYQANPSPFSKILLEKMENDPDPEYGEGYRKMRARLNEAGWSQLLGSL
jgi:hypothetical protein